MKTLIKFQTTVRRWCSVLMMAAFMLALVPTSLTAQAKVMQQAKTPASALQKPTVKENPALVRQRLQIDNLRKRNAPSVPPPNALADAVYDKVAFKGVLSLGRGYNVITGGYADSEGHSLSKLFILDIDKLLKDGQIGLVNVSNSSENNYYEKSISKYSQKRAVEVNVSGSYMFFKAGINASYSSSIQGEYGRSFASLSYYAPQYILYINPKVDISKYIHPNYKKDVEGACLDTKKFDQLIKDYGTHLVRSVIIGGRIDHSVTWSSQYQITDEQVAASVKASYNALVYSVSAEVNVNTSNVRSDFSTNTISSTKGIPSIAPTFNNLTRSNIEEWFDKMVKEPGFCGFEHNSLIPVYDVAKQANILIMPPHKPGQLPPSSRHLLYKRKYEDYAKGLSNVAETMPNIECITGIALYDTRRKQGAETNYPPNWNKLGIIGVTCHGDASAEYYLYFRRSISNEQNLPIVDIFFTNITKGEDANARFNRDFKDDPTARLHSVQLLNGNKGNHININRGRFGADKIELYYVTSKNIGINRPIQRLQTMLIWGDGVKHYDPNDLKIELPGFFMVNNMKGDRQDSTQGANPNKTESHNGKTWKPIKDRFLRYSKEK